MCKIVIKCKKKKKIRIIPIVGKISEQSHRVDKTPEYFSNRKGKVILQMDMTSSQQVKLSVKFEDKKGNAAKVDGAPQWGTDNTDVLALTPSFDGLSCQVVAVGPLGTAKVTMTADADLGEGTKLVLGTVDINITAGEAVNVKIDAEEPTEQP